MRALVTGGSQGIGRAICQAFLDLGWEVVVADLVEPDLPVEFLPCDLGDVGAVEGLVASAWPFDVLVNNAAVMVRASVLETSSAEWDRLMAVNLRAPFLLLQGAAKRWVAEGQPGVVVNVSSGHAVLAGWDRSAYAAAKAGIEALTRNAALELTKQGVMVYGVAPGFTFTEMSRRSLVGERLAAVEARLPAGRVAEAGEVAQAVVLLATGQLGYAVGQTLRLDGGWTNSDIRYGS